MDKQVVAGIVLIAGAVAASLLVAAWMGSVWGLAYAVSLKGTFLAAGTVLLIVAIFSLGAPRMPSEYWSRSSSYVLAPIQDQAMKRALASRGSMQVLPGGPLFAMTLAAGITLFTASFVIA